MPLIVVLGIFTLFTLRFSVPGVTKHVNKNRQDENERSLDTIPERTLNFLNDLNKVVITVNGFIIIILGGFLVASGLNNFYFFLGFETIIFSLVSSILAYPSFIGSIKLQNEVAIIKARLEGFFKIFAFSSWSLILGLILLATSFS